MPVEASNQVAVLMSLVVFCSTGHLLLKSACLLVVRFQRLALLGLGVICRRSEISGSDRRSVQLEMGLFPAAHLLLGSITWALLSRQPDQDLSVNRCPLGEK